MDIRDIVGLWCDDITFCQEECGLKDCPRNKKNIRDRTVPHSFSVEIPSDCLKKQEEGKVQVKAVIYIDVPEWQIGEDVTVYFPDTMMKHGKCELLKEQEAVEPKTTIAYNGSIYNYCGACNRLLPVAQDFEKAKFCPHCGMPVRLE